MTTVRTLRDLGKDAVHLREAGLQSLPDDHILTKAVDEDRIGLTFDPDFGDLLAASGTGNFEFKEIRKEDRVLKTTILSNPESFTREFERCCRAYTSLHIATAWCGDPRFVLPYAHLESMRGRIKATIGMSFNYTHPDALDLLKKFEADLRVFNKNTTLFHPKVYFFSSGERGALFVGSSNLTYAGFYCNAETNVLLEGLLRGTDQTPDITAALRQFEVWHTDKFSFVPSPEWMAKYRNDYAEARKREQEYRIQTPPICEHRIPVANWLRNADWDTYYLKVVEGLELHGHTMEDYLAVLRAAKEHLPIPWEPSYFDNREKRRIIGGLGEYGWLGHVGASGRFMRLLAYGTHIEKAEIADAINAIATLNLPLAYDNLIGLLEKLVALGPTMKVWGRVLCLVRPDMYCTVASPSVRKNLSQALNVSRESFSSVHGYIQLMRLLHSSPWFQSPEPINESEKEVWHARAALMDTIFYSGHTPS
ncbi:MAG: DUF5615 family PIN-like protein [Acidobacteriaceae bacterium]|nr:DUF5615 family PIN-like protein [Acidobacteriaceae bacterium]MBV9779552.1 DUF5615 family PIN-like protein [Acidobacteriaceae bacterium]